MSKHHTPTPWIKVSHDEDEFIVVQKSYRPGFYDPVTEYMTEQNADFIVKACNNHDRLVEALEYAKEHLDFFKYNGLFEPKDNKFEKLNQLLTELKS